MWASISTERSSIAIPLPSTDRRPSWVSVARSTEKRRMTRIRQRRIRLTTTLGFAVLVAGVWTAHPACGAELLPTTELRVRHPEEVHRSQVLTQPLVVPPGMAYQFDVWIDPVRRDGGNFEVAPGFSFGLPSADANAIPYGDKHPRSAFGNRETVGFGRCSSMELTSARTLLTAATMTTKSIRNQTSSHIEMGRITFGSSVFPKTGALVCVCTLKTCLGRRRST